MLHHGLHSLSHCSGMIMMLTRHSVQRDYKYKRWPVRWGRQGPENELNDDR